MKATLTVALALAALLAVAGVAGYALVSHGSALSGSPAANPGSAGMGTLDVSIQDAPAANFSHVYVTFDQIAVHPADGNASDWQTVNLTERTIDLASVKNVPQLLGNANLKAGTYTQLRIVVQSAQGVMVNGTKVNFTVPSGELKTADAFNITLGQTTSLTIDINLARSIVEAGNTWIFTPVLGSVQIS
jgi:hypothetical protein